MQLDDEQYLEMVDSVVDEGEPELLIGPVPKATTLPAGLPVQWARALIAPNPVAVIVQMWKPMESRLPRVCQALRERLRGVGLLRTEERKPSLVYLFADANGVFAFRGYPPLTKDALGDSVLPTDFLDFYQIHDGWVNLDSEDGGPLPMAGWLPLSEVWDDVALRLPPGDSSPDTLVTVYRDGTELALVFDTSNSPILPLRCRSDGSADVLLDIWISIDREIAEFLEEMVMRSDIGRGDAVPGAEDRAAAAQRHEELLARAADRRTRAAHFGGGGIHEQLCDLALAQARSEKSLGGDRERVVASYRQALREFCASVDLGGDVSAEEILDWFGIAHALDDVAGAHFVATIPVEMWNDESLAAFHARALLCLFLGDVDHAKEFVDEILGMTYDQGVASAPKDDDGEDEPERGAAIDPGADITAQMLDGLTRMDAAAFAEARQRAINELTRGRAQQRALLPWSMRLRGFDAVALRYGLMRRRSGQ